MFRSRNTFMLDRMSIVAADQPPIDPNLVDAAAKVLDTVGLNGLTLVAIAEAAGVSRVTLHRRGTSVDEYLVAVLGRASDDLRASLWDTLTSSRPASDRLRVALTTLCEVCERHSGIMAAMYCVPALPRRQGRTTSFEFIEPYAKLFTDGDVDGSILSADPLRDATLVANSVAWTYLHMRRAHGWTIDDTTDHVVSMAISSYVNR